MRAITVSVDYADLLEITLPRNAHHFDQVVVVTAPGDEATLRVVKGVSNAVPFVTDAFYRRGAAFNKGLALEEGFDHLGRSGWLCIFDADTLLPPSFTSEGLELGYIHAPRRRMVVEPSQSLDAITGYDWRGFEKVNDGEPAGYCQIFHANDPHLERRPWYGVDWQHAGGCDSDFNQHWPRTCWRWLSWECLHLGPHGQNWNGRATLRLDGTWPEQAEARAQRQREMLRRRGTEGVTREKLT